MSFNKTSEINTINIHLKNGTLNTYNFDKFGIDNQLSLFSNLGSWISKGHILFNDKKNNQDKNFKMEYYYPLLEKIVNQINVIYFDKLNKYSEQDKLNYQINLESYVVGILLPKINNLIKGQNLLSKLNPIIEKLFGSNNITILNYLCETAKGGSYLSFLYWLSKTKEKTIENLSIHYKKNIFTTSISNSDDRIYKYVLDNILKNDKLFFQKNSSLIKDLFYSLANSLVPIKYILKRIKLFSTYISLVPYFQNMIDEFKDIKLLLELHKHYYVVPYNYKNLAMLIRNILQYSIDILEANTLSMEKIININTILKTDEEKNMLKLILSTEYNYLEKSSKYNFQMNQIIYENYETICEILVSNKFLSSLNNNEINYNVLRVLTSNNLLTKWIESKNCSKSEFWMDENFKLLFFTRFLNISKQKQTIIKINKLLHLLRLCAKRKVKNNHIDRQVKMFDLLKEIKTYIPNVSVPILKKGSHVFQQQKQKFTNLPPRHLLPGEISVYEDFLIKEKADGILINNLPVGIYPMVNIINNYQVKAEYIEDLDLYLIFDIDIPNTTIIERYNMLRDAHPYTESLCLNQINNLDQFMYILKDERKLIKKFMDENQSQSIKWYPKFACKYVKNNNKLHTELINNIIIGNDEIILDAIKSSDPFNCDGLIITPLNGDREIKIKPKSMMSIDLLYDNKKWLDRDLIDWSNIIDSSYGSKKNGKIYRCYPNLDTLPELKFKVGEFRYDKKNPNPNNIVDIIINIIKYDWNKDLENIETFYYDQNKKINSKKLIETINAQNDLLEQKINDLEPSVNKNWLDLGCGRGKLIPLIKKFNPKKYMGLDADVKQLVRALKFHDENQNVYQFSPYNLADKWSNTNYKWQSINTNIKYDYVIANFSIMHFFTSEFWNQLNEIVHEETKFMFNIVNVRSEKKWTESESFLEVVDGVTKYKFEWTHNEVKTEPYIDQIQIEEALRNYGWKVLSSQDINSKYPLINMYRWLIIQKC